MKIKRQFRKSYVLFVGLVIGLFAMVLTPATVSFLFSKSWYWIHDHNYGILAAPLAILVWAFCLFLLLSTRGWIVKNCQRKGLRIIKLND